MIAIVNFIYAPLMFFLRTVPATQTQKIPEKEVLVKFNYANNINNFLE